MRRLAAAAAVLLGALLAGVASADDIEPVYGYDDRAARAPDLAEWAPNIQSAPYFETWDMWFWGDDGTFYLVQFLTSSFGYGIERQASGRLIIVDPDAANLGAAAPGVSLGDRGFDWESGGWRWDEDEDFAITFSDCYLRGDGRSFQTRIRGRDRRAYAELEFELAEPLYRPGDGRVELGWDRHDFMEVQAMPRLTFHGRVNRKPSREAPDDWRDVSGVGTFNHTLTNTFPFEVASSFTRFRALRQDGLTIAFDALTAPPEHGGRTLGWATVGLDGARVFEATDVTYSQTDVRGFAGGSVVYPVPHGYEIRAAHGDDWLYVVVRDGALVSAESPFARVGAFLRAALGALMSPYDFELSVTYEAWIHVDGHTAQVAGSGWSTSNFTR